MKKANTSLLFGAMALMLQGPLRGQSAISYDGVNDFVEVLSASQHVTNKSISMAFWIYPTNSSPAYPNFDGFAGFRNNSNADFYILQLSSTNVECRFRNSSGVNYDINAAALVLNQWNHYVLTYDQSVLTLYHNGFLISSTSAAGTFSNAFVSLHLGKLDWSPTPFYSTAQMDEFGLWNRALSQVEVTALYGSCSIPNNSAGLQLHYAFEEGIAGGNNTTVSTAIDLKGNTNGTYTNVAMTGMVSNFIAKSGDMETSDTVQACHSYTDSLGNDYTQSGFYSDTSVTAAGCLSIANLYLTIMTADTLVTQIGTTLQANDTTALSYVWFDCASGASVGSNASFTAAANGQYACVINGGNGCMDTTACYSISGIGLGEWSALAWLATPRPGVDHALHLTGPMDGVNEVRLYNALGECVQLWQHGPIESKQLVPGMYAFVISTAQRQYSLKALVH
ncbi:MAG: hypothetical protein ABR98_06605 [Cryomorphaceae bacterium BACL7 MAG-120910-bin2]|jgi:hypothetical protein|nr:MAG: hypothetical protein ABR98_06605 [Cryomorphaceae bacterium BACL7 MAG-120910-bin2]